MTDDGLYAIGNDDRAYRRMEEYDGNYADSYVVNTSTGERKQRDRNRGAPDEVRPEHEEGRRGQKDGQAEPDGIARERGPRLRLFGSEPRRHVAFVGVRGV